MSTWLLMLLKSLRKAGYFLSSLNFATSHVNLLKMFFCVLIPNTHCSDWTVLHPRKTAASPQLCFKGHFTSPVLSQLITGRLTHSNSVFNVNLFEILIWKRTLWGIQSINSEPRLSLHIKWVPSLAMKFNWVRKKLQTQNKKENFVKI